VSGTSNVGGLVGWQNYSSIAQAYATGAVGGTSNVGGLVGWQNYSSIAQAYATGAVSGASNVGGLVGNNTSGTYAGTFWDTDTTDQACATGTSCGVSGITGLTTAQFQDAAGFMMLAGTAGWNFQTAWAPPSAGYYPELYALSPVVWVQADDVSRDYGDDNPTFTAAGTFGGPSFYAFGPTDDTLSFSPTLLTSATSASDVGDYAITGIPVSAASTGGVTYRVVYTGMLTVDPRWIEVTADAQSKAYGAGDPALTYQITSGSLVFTDAFAGALTRDPGEHKGDYAITQGTLTLGSNYALSYIGDFLTIEKKLKKEKKQK
jgi:hypothetical protein